MAIVAGVIIGTGGAAAPVVAPIVAESATAVVAVVEGAAVVEAATAVVAVVEGVGEAMILAAEIEAAAASMVAANAAIAGAPALVVAGAGAGAGGATTAAATVAVANSWNPAGWLIGTVLVGASQCSSTSQTVTWGCYKPIIDEAVNEATLAGPMTLAALASHPKVQRISIGLCAASAGLPEVELTNTAGEIYLLRGVPLPWGGAAYHAERIDNE